MSYACPIRWARRCSSYSPTNVWFIHTYHITHARCRDTACRSYLCSSDLACRNRVACRLSAEQLRLAFRRRNIPSMWGPNKCPDDQHGTPAKTTSTLLAAMHRSSFRSRRFSYASMLGPIIAVSSLRDHLSETWCGRKCWWRVG